MERELWIEWTEFGEDISEESGPRVKPGRSNLSESLVAADWHHANRVIENFLKAVFDRHVERESKKP